MEIYNINHYTWRADNAGRPDNRIHSKNHLKLFFQNEYERVQVDDRNRFKFPQKITTSIRCEMEWILIFLIICQKGCFHSPRKSNSGANNNNPSQSGLRDNRR